MYFEAFWSMQSSAADVASVEPTKRTGGVVHEAAGLISSTRLQLLEGRMPRFMLAPGDQV